VAWGVDRAVRSRGGWGPRVLPPSRGSSEAWLKEGHLAPQVGRCRGWRDGVRPHVEQFRLVLEVARVWTTTSRRRPGTDSSEGTSTRTSGGRSCKWRSCAWGRALLAYRIATTTVACNALRGRRPRPREQPAIILEVPLPEPTLGVIEMAGPNPDVLSTSLARLTRDGRRVTRQGVRPLAF